LVPFLFGDSSLILSPGSFGKVAATVGRSDCVVTFYGEALPQKTSGSQFSGIGKDLTPKEFANFTPGVPTLGEQAD